MALVITGANAFVKISGQVVLFAGGVSVTHENRLEEIPQLDDLTVAEYAETGHRCAVTINSFKLAPGASIGGVAISNSATDFNMDFHNDGSNISGAQPSPDVKQILLQPEMIIEVVNIVNGEEVAIYTALGCKFEGGSGQVDARGIWQGSWSFKCRSGTGI